ncbi:hypothetical protein J5X84_00975 [Streptosporangiaceae bacterium NEAU-GS5]|nr:hypothetical protein [Streptosporangiaceae bacterium NEAU-GS5]
MSLTVSPELLEAAKTGEVKPQDFLDCVRTSLPYAWTVISELAQRRESTGAEFADNTTEPPTDEARGQLLRCMASDAMRGAIERHFSVRLAFQNCHRVAVFDPGAHGAYERFIRPEAQLLNQSPELVNC